MPYVVSKSEFEQLVQQALEELPQPFDQHVEELSIQIRDQPTEQQIRKLKLGSNDLLLGLYEGRPLTQRSVMDEMFAPDVIFIFQVNVQKVSRSPQELVAQVRKTVLHEIGHHFGMSEEDLDKLGYG